MFWYGVYFTHANGVGGQWVGQASNEAAAICACREKHDVLSIDKIVLFGKE